MGYLRHFDTLNSSLENKFQLNLCGLTGSIDLLQNLINSVQFGVAHINTSGDIVLVNKAWNTFYNENNIGFQRKFRGENYLDICKRAGFEGAPAHKGIESVLNGERETFTLEYPCHGPHRERWFLLNVIKLEKFSGALIAHIDITQRKLNERITSTNSIQDILDNASDGVFTLTLNGEFVDINKAGLELLGYAKHEIVGRNVADMVPEQELGIHYQFYEAYKKIGTTRRSERKIRKKDGTYIVLEASGKSYPDGLVRSFVRDITDRKRNESRELFLSLLSKVVSETLDYGERLQRIVEAAVPALSDLCFISMLEEGEFKFKAVAAKNEDIKNLMISLASPVKAQGGVDRFTSNYVSDTKKPVLVKSVRDEILNNPQVDDLLKKRLQLIGVTSYLSLPLVTRGKVIGTVTFSLLDLERRFENRDLAFFELVANRCAFAVENAKLYLEAQEAIMLRENIMAMVSHDLKNPLAAILMNADLLMRLKSTKTPAQIEKFALRIKHSSHLMNRLISDILDFSKIQAGTFGIFSEKFNLDDAIDEAIEILRPNIYEKKLELLKETERDLFVQGDGFRIIQVLTNLLSNAIKFSPLGSAIKIQAKIGEGRVRVSIFDKGPGIPSEQIPFIFDRYWQADETAHKGTGLGLFIARGIMKAHKEKIEVDSTVGSGSCFSFCLPIQSE